MVIALSMTAGAQTQIKEHRRSITLDEAIVIARTQSVDAAVALNELKTAYWEIPHIPRQPFAGNEFEGNTAQL